MLGDLDSLMDSLNKQPEWKPKFAVGDAVEAMYAEDELWYAAVIDRIEPEIERYVLTFTDYGNEQVTCEEDVRPTVHMLMQAREKELAPAVQDEMLKKKKRRQSLLVAHPELLKKPPKPSGEDGHGGGGGDDDGQEDEADNEASGEGDPDAAAEALEKLLASSGQMTNEQRKQLLLQQARRMSVGSDADRSCIRIDKNGTEPTGPPQASPNLGKKAHSDRHLDNLRKNERLLSRGRSSSTVELKSSDRVGGSQGIFGDMEALLNPRQRADSESAIDGKKVEPAVERKVWADNLMLKKKI